MSDDIVERLRERGAGQEMFGFDGMLDDGDPLLIEAADEIERLMAENKALALGHPNVANAEILRRMEAAEAEVAALRALLEQAWTLPSVVSVERWRTEVAAALAAKEQP